MRHFILILCLLLAAMAAAVAFPRDIASLSTAEVVFLMPLSIRLAPLLREASFVFLMITEHPHSFESCACAVLGKPGGVGSGDRLAGLLHWTGISVAGSRSAGNVMTSAGPDDNVGRQFWRQFSLMGDTSAIIFQNENCPAIIFGSGHQGLLGHWGRQQFWATILVNNFGHELGCYSSVIRAQTGQRSAREM